MRLFGKKIDELVRNSELESIVPHLSDEKFKQLKEDIYLNPVHVEVPIIIGTVEGVENTIIDGYNRHKVVIELIKEKKISCIYQIPVSESPIKGLQAAKEYSIEMNLVRRQLNPYQTATWALNVYGKNTEKEIAGKVGIAMRRINTIKTLNDRILNTQNCADSSKIEEYKEALNSGEKTPETVLKELKTAEEVSSGLRSLRAIGNKETVKEIVKVSASKEKLVNSNDTVETLKAKIDRSKYNSSAKKQLEKLMDIQEHPEDYTEEAVYLRTVQKFKDTVDTLENKYPNEVIMLEEEKAGLENTYDFLKNNIGKKKFLIVLMLEMPKVMQ